MGRINPEVAGAAAPVRSRARYLAANSPFIANAVGNYATALSGTGIMATPKHSDTDTRAALSENFDLWAESCDAEQRTDWYGLQADISRGLVVDGEAFVQIIQTADGLKLRLLPPELVDETLTRDLGDGAVIVSGVEFDASGQRVAYHVLADRPNNQFASYAPPVRVPADQLLHVMKSLSAGQVRGISWLAPMILPANEFDQLCDALLTGAKVAAMHAGFITDLNGTATDPYQGNELDGGLEPGALKRLPVGTDVKFNSPDQSKDLSAFIRLNLQQLAAGLGLPEHMLSGDLTGANYSSLRAGLLPFRQRVEAIQYLTLVPQLLNPVFREVTTWAVLSGELNAPDFEANPRAYFACEWLPPAHLQVDPKKQIDADIAELEAGLTSRRKLVAQRGWNIEDLDSEIAADKREVDTSA